MSLKDIASGAKIPHDFNVIIEIPMNAPPVKYEVDKKSGALFVDRLLTTAMFYPANYGYIPHTLSQDGDPVDVLVITPCPLVHGSVINCRAVGLLKMTDEAGIDAKILAVPVDKVSKIYSAVKNYQDLPQHQLQAIEHFFTHYKDLEQGKWVKIEGWEGPEIALQEVQDSVTRFA